MASNTNKNRKKLQSTETLMGIVSGRASTKRMRLYAMIREIKESRKDIHNHARESLCLKEH